MTSLLLRKEYLRRFYSHYGYGIQPTVRLLFVLYTTISLNTNIGYVAKFGSPLIILPVCLVSALLLYDIVVFLTGCLMTAHVYATSLGIALVVVAFILTIIILYYRFKPEDSYLMVPALLASLSEISYVVPLLVGLGRSLASMIPVEYGVFLCYLLVYVGQDADILATSDGFVDIVQKYSQILKSVLFSQTVMVTTTTCVMGITVVYLIYRLSMDCIWVVAIVVDTVAELLAMLVGDFIFGVSIPVGQMILGLVLSTIITVVLNFFVLSVDYIRTEYAQFEGDDCYCYVKTVPKMTVSTPDVKIQKTSTHKCGTRERDSY